MNFHVTMKRANKSRKSSSTVPHGWTMEYDANERPVYRCYHIQRGIDGMLRRCTFRCRKYQIKNGHSHRYYICAVNDPGFPKELCEREDIRTIDDMNSQILDALALVAGRLDISASKAMNSFICQIMRIALSLRKKCNDELIIQNVKIFDEKIISERIKYTVSG